MARLSYPRCSGSSSLSWPRPWLPLPSLGWTGVVGIRTRDDRQVEVELDGALRVVELEDEDPRDE